MSSGEEKKPSAPVRFHTNLIGICDLVIDIIAKVTAQKVSTDLDIFSLNVGKGMLEAKDPETLINNFITKSCYYWPQIQKKDEGFIINNATVLFGEGVPSSYIKSFSNLFLMYRAEGKVLLLQPDQATEGLDLVVDREDRKTLWEWIHSLVRISIVYVHEKRKPDPVTKKYQVEFFPQLSVRKSSELFGVRI